MKQGAYHWGHTNGRLEKGIFSLAYCQDREDCGRLVASLLRDGVPIEQVVRIARNGYRAAWKAEIKRSLGHG